MSNIALTMGMGKGKADFPSVTSLIAPLTLFHSRAQARWRSATSPLQPHSREMASPLSKSSWGQVRAHVGGEGG